MEPEQEIQKTPATAEPQPLGPSPEVREVLYRAVALGLVIIAGIVILALAVAGLAGISPGPGVIAHPGTIPVATPTPVTQGSPAATTTAMVTASPRPTIVTPETIPAGSALAVTIEPKTSGGSVLIRFDGGPGKGLVKVIGVQLTTPEGTVVTGTLDPQTTTPELTLQGSRGTDRVVVTATFYSGKVYTVADEESPYYQRF